MLSLKLQEKLVFLTLYVTLPYDKRKFPVELKAETKLSNLLLN